MQAAVVGLGKVGLPLAVQIASKGVPVAGYDIDAAKVSMVNDGRNPLPGEAGLDERVPSLVAAGLLRATTDPGDAAASADVIAIIVPVDIDPLLQPDFALLDAATAAIGPHVRRGSLVIVETTVPVGTTRGRVGAAISAASGLEPGTGFSLAFSPERVSSGHVLRDLATYPKIVGGIDAHSSALAADFYGRVLDAPVMTVRDAETAEFSKLAETTYRDVNIALANEFARLADRAGVDALQAIQAANSQPYSHIHEPGVGVGGHCIPVYPYFLPHDETELVAAARHINDDMAHYAVRRLVDRVGEIEGWSAVVLGLAFRPGVKEWRHSSAFGLVNALAGVGVKAFVHDPLFSADEIRAHGLEPVAAFPLACDLLVIQAWHPEYHSLDFGQFAGLRAVLDGRAALDPERFEGTGIAYVGVGR